MAEQDVQVAPSAPVSEDVQTQVPPATQPVVTPAPGSQTPPENLLAALKEERQMRKEAEEREAAALAEADRLRASSVQEGEVFSDEGKLLDAKIKAQDLKLAKLEEEREIERLQTLFPALKEKVAEFQTYRQDFPRHKLENVAKLFLTELGVLTEPRMGLEPAGGAAKAPIQSGKMSVEDAQLLRTTNFRAYQDKVMKGEIDIG